MVCVLGVRIHTLRLHGKGIPRPWGSVGENMGEALPLFHGVCPFQGSSLSQVLPLCSPFLLSEEREFLPLGGS